MLYANTYLLYIIFILYYTYIIINKKIIDGKLQVIKIKR